MLLWTERLRKLSARHGTSGTDLSRANLTGEDALSLYEFNTDVAKHYFCKYCGIHPFHRPRAAPDKWTVNVRCLDGVDLSRLDVVLFDGANFEEAVKTFKYR